jgi:hypothetical protein
MFTQTGLYSVIAILTYLALFNYASAMPSDASEQDQKRSLATLLGRAGLERDYLPASRPQDFDDEDNGAVLHKRAMKRKWANFFQGGSESPYAIAFPALIRSRRHLAQE